MRQAQYFAQGGYSKLSEKEYKRYMHARKEKELQKAA
jgi:hypothetical protein